MDNLPVQIVYNTQLNVNNYSGRGEKKHNKHFFFILQVFITEYILDTI